MPNLVAQIAPQRSTQYAQLATQLAPYELALSPLGAKITDLQPVTLGGQAYLRFDYAGEVDEALLTEVGSLAMTSAYFEYYDHVEPIGGPLLKPLMPTYAPFLPPDIAEARRYRGKTNEMLTLFMLNVARHSSAFAHRPWQTLRVYDPLAGGGTTLLTALVLGAEVAGSDEDREAIDGIARFIRQYTKEARISCKLREEKIKNVGKRWWAEIKQGDTVRRCLMARGDVGDGAKLLHGFKKPHVIVTDLPYGIQHSGALTELLQKALPVWAEVLDEGGTLVFSWDATRFSREDMVGLVREARYFTVLDEAPYNQLTHRVDRVIQQRDILVARLTT
ncbi:hypothetical protein G4Y79_03590 [Phototrophicus methaneseepsis]|uniref:Uncharacterized protein n=1 Tax=Phototrophicus methaneseepsis TaxID=2710758 RepID=A0A7S8EAR2_9CHLR|nr:hypothetical protein [Phototrophicus methaneseepsis]QPC83477.1 hypothetical protein G4Y79_03590 [Phototrophicus methaneseepsis]